MVLSASRRGAAGGLRRAGWGVGLKAAVWLLELAPLAVLLTRAALDALGANPTEALVRGSGDWALRSLGLALAITPLRQLCGWPALAALRRVCGLFAFFWASVHALSYVGLDQGGDWAAVWADVGKRPFILLGALTWLGLSALALSSPAAVVRRLGARRWRSLHRLVYGLGGLALLHFALMRAGKNDWSEVIGYACGLAVLLAWRLGFWLKNSLYRASSMRKQL